MGWLIEVRPEVREWLLTLDAKTAQAVDAALEVLEQEGPRLGRPLVDVLKNTKLKNLKELRPGSAKQSKIRILFAFDPIRQAVLLVAGDKSGEWNQWYDRMIPLAEQRFMEHVSELKKGGKL